MRRGVAAQRLIWAAPILMALGLLQSLLQPYVGWAPAAIVVALIVLTMIKPYEGLCVLAALAPLATAVFVTVAPEPGNFRFHEAVALAFITGWAVRRVAQPRPSAMPPALRWSTAGLLTLVLASTVVVGSIAAAENMVTTPAELFSVLVSRQYLAAVGPLTAAMLLAEGLVLMTIAAETCAGDRVRRETVLRLMVFGATAAAAINLLRLVFAALGQENPVSLFGTYFFTRRVNVHYSDLNAAGSYFGMMLLIATGFVVRARALAISAAALIAAAVWLTGSRTAMAAVFATALAGGLLAFRGRPAVSRMRIAAGLAVLVLAAGGVWMTYPKGRNAAGDWSMSTRVELAKAGLNMTAREPIFGVGIGRFYTLSNEYAGTMLAAQGKVRENAHNYYLQVLAELGVSGLILFLTVIVLALREAWRASDTWGPQRALFAGLVVFLITCMAGHPLLVAGAAMVFWMALGLSAAPGANPPASASRRMQVAAIVLLALIVAAVPLRTAAAAKFANLEHVTIGFSRWQTQPDGVRYRWAGGRSTFHVSSAAISVRIPLRHGGAGAQPIEVVVFLDGREINRMLLPSDLEWRSVWVTPRKTVAAGFSRIDLEAREAGQPTPLSIAPTDTSGAILVGRPVIDF